MSENGKKAVGIISLILFLIFIGVITWFIGKPIISFVSEPEKFRLWVDSHGIFGRIIFVGMVFFQVVLALIPGEPLEIGAGYAFGTFEGTVLTVLGTVLGSITVFFLVRRWGIKLCEVFFLTEKIRSLIILKNRKQRDILIFTVFFLPGTPKDLLTYFLGLTDVKLSQVLFLSGIARLPSIITSTLGGDALGIKKYAVAIPVFGVTLIVSGIGILVYNKLVAKRKRIKGE